MLPTTNELRAFELFLKALEGVSSRQQYEERARGFEKVAEKKNICFSDFLEKIATHIKQCGPANANRRGWGKMDNFNKKGFDNLMIFGPEEFVNIVKSGGDEVLKKFSFQFADAAMASKSKSGILDPFQNEMNPKIWVFTEGQDLPKISEDLKEKILEKTQIFLDKYDMKLKALTFYGGNAGYQYGEGSDIDIGIYTEWPEERVPEYEEMLDFCRKELSFLHEGIEVHLFLKDPAEKEAVEANENVYEILTDTWLQKPKRLDVDPKEELAPFIEKGSILVQKMQVKFDNLMSELKNLKKLDIDEVPVSYLEAFKPLVGIVKQLRVNRNIEHKTLRKKAVNNEDITFFDRATQNEVAWKLLTETKMLSKLDEIKRILEPKKNTSTANSIPYYSWDGQSVKEVLEKWQHGGLKLYDEYVHGELPTEELWMYREFDRPLNKELMEKIKKEGYNKESPIIVVVTKDGKAWVSEGNHRLVIARELKIEKLPVRFVFYSKS